MNLIIRVASGLIQLVEINPSKEGVANLLRAHTPLQRMGLIESVAEVILEASASGTVGQPVTVQLPYSLGSYVARSPLTLNSLFVTSHPSNVVEDALVKFMGQNGTQDRLMPKVTKGVVATTPFHSMVQHAVMKKLADKILAQNASPLYKKQARETVAAHAARVEEYKAIQPTIWLVPEVKIGVKTDTVYIVEPEGPSSSLFSTAYKVVDYSNVPSDIRVMIRELKDNGFETFSRIKGSTATPRQVLAVLANEKASEFVRDSGNLITLQNTKNHNITWNDSLKATTSLVAKGSTLVANRLHDLTYGRSLSGQANRASFLEKWRLTNESVLPEDLGVMGVQEVAKELATIYGLPSTAIPTLAMEITAVLGSADFKWEETGTAVKADAQQFLSFGTTPLWWEASYRNGLTVADGRLRLNLAGRKYTLKYVHPDAPAFTSVTMYGSSLINKSRLAISHLREALSLTAAWIKGDLHTPAASLTGTIIIPISPGAASIVLPSYVVPENFVIAVNKDL
jgi:hypothetical protein